MSCINMFFKRRCDYPCIFLGDHTGDRFSTILVINISLLC
ncbi:DUF4049 domain-containing protein [Escherichia coli]|nr:DUF4049 domain-containing protein [Escherichia coli]